MATTLDDGLSSGREGLSEGEIKPQKLKRMKNHLGLALNFLLRRNLILKIEILVADWRRLESLAPIGRAKENLASI